MPTWLTVGGYQEQPLPIVSALTMTRNGNGVTLAKRFYDEGVIDGNALKQMLLESQGAAPYFWHCSPLLDAQFAPALLVSGSWN
jgi:hypothetical protein